MDDQFYTTFFLNSPCHRYDFCLHEIKFLLIISLHKSQPDKAEHPPASYLFLEKAPTRQYTFPPPNLTDCATLNPQGTRDRKQPVTT